MPHAAATTSCRPATDAGIDLGWDDEQVTVWLNRQLEAMRKRLDPLQKAVEAPLGVSGYRVDVRMPGSIRCVTIGSRCVSRSLDRGLRGQPGRLSFPPAAAEPRIHVSFRTAN